MVAGILFHAAHCSRLRQEPRGVTSCCTDISPNDPRDDPNGIPPLTEDNLFWDGIFVSRIREQEDISRSLDFGNVSGISSMSSNELVVAVTEGNFSEHGMPRPAPAVQKLSSSSGSKGLLAGRVRKPSVCRGAGGAAGVREDLDIAHVRLETMHPALEGVARFGLTRSKSEDISTSIHDLFAACKPAPHLKGGNPFVIIVSVLRHRHADIALVAHALGLSCFLAGLAEHGEQNCCQDRNYRDHHQQFNEGKAYTMRQRR